MTTGRSRAGNRPAGSLFEYRVGRLRFCQGYFVRRSIDIWPSGFQGAQLAELDLVAVSFDPQLRRSLEVIECKTGQGGGGEIDRVVWLRGLAPLTGADALSFAKLSVADRTRDFARRLRVDVLDESGITSAEEALDIQWGLRIGFHDAEFGEDVVKPARSELTSSNELRNAGKYLFGSYWFNDDFSRVKQLRTLFRLLVHYASSVSPPALRLGIGEATVLFVLASISIASWRNQRSEEDFRRFVSAELSTGFGDSRSLRLLLRRADELQREHVESLHDLYQKLGVPRVPFLVKTMESEALTPPEWVDAFVDLVTRFSRRPHSATNLLRWTDLWAARLVGTGSAEGPMPPLFLGQERELQTGLDLVLTFLSRVWDVPASTLGLAPSPLEPSISTVAAVSSIHDRDSAPVTEPLGTPPGAQVIQQALPTEATPASESDDGSSTGSGKRQSESDDGYAF